jgi:hypothetical protein
MLIEPECGVRLKNWLLVAHISSARVVCDASIYLQDNRTVAAREQHLSYDMACNVRQLPVLRSRSRIIWSEPEPKRKAAPTAPVR